MTYKRRYAVVRKNAAVAHTFKTWHATLGDAIEEAGRLAIKEQDCFFVLQEIGMAKPPQMSAEFMKAED